jgi:RHS repeat-associated protein
VKKWANNNLVAGEQFGYGFDTIGNRTKTLAGGDQNGGGLRQASYTANALNQYTGRTVPGAVDVIGSVTNTGSVWVDQTVPYRTNNYFWEALPVTNGPGPVYQTVTTLAALTNGNPNNAWYGTTNIGHVFVPQTPESYSYDLDGNLLTDGHWNYTWDGENRLIALTNNANIALAGQYALTFAYDYQGRRIQKLVWTNSGSAYVPEYTNRFVYDGWNLSAILNPNASIAASFMWGTDLSGSMQGAGGVGGLLAENLAGNGVQFAAYDANGNVAALVSASSGTVTANYEYGPFGEVIRATGPMAKVNPFRFSTKYQDDETGLLYYGYRFYNPSTGRWLNRDQRDERKWEKNVYSFAENRPINSYDLLGLYSVASCQANVDKIMNNPGASSRELRKVLAAIKAIPGCTPLKPTCMCCTGNDNKNWVGYVDGGNLNICANNIKDTSLLLETLVHENIHVLQKCRKQDLNSCDGAVCSEIQAALNDGTCQRTSPNDVRSCVINEAATSSENRCGSRENARQRAEALYDQCNQSEP